MKGMLDRPLTLADWKRIDQEQQEQPEALIAAGKQATAEWVANRRKKPIRRKRHGPTR